MSGWFLLASAIVQYQRKIKLSNYKKNPVGPFGTMLQEPWHSGKGAKSDCVVQLNCGEVRTHASYKTTRTWEDFNSRGAKMFLLSDEL